MAQLPGFVVVHRADEDHQLRYPHVVSVAGLAHPKIARFQQGAKLILILHEGGYIFRLQAEHGGIPLRQHFGLVLPQIGGGKVLPHQVLFLHHVAVAEDEPHRAAQGVQQPVQVGRDVASCAARAQHDDLHRAGHRKLHWRASQSFSPGVPVMGRSTGGTLLRSSFT